MSPAACPTPDRRERPEPEARTLVEKERSFTSAALVM